MHDIAQAAGIPVWCGGMLEAGIGRAHNIALATLAQLRAARRRLRQQALLEAGHHPARGGDHAAAARSSCATSPASATRIDHDFIRSITVREEVYVREDRRQEACPTAMNPFVSLLRDNHNYRNTWIGQVVSEIGDHFNNVAVFSLVLAQTTIGMVVTGVMLARAIPAMLAGPLAGVLLDRFDRKRMMIASDLVRAVVALGFILTVNRHRDLAALPAQRTADGWPRRSSPAGAPRFCPRSPPRRNCTPPTR